MLVSFKTRPLREAFIESLTCADVNGMPLNTGALTVFTNDAGGIEDDLIVSKTSANHLYVVSNAGCLEKDLTNMRNSAKKWRGSGKDVEVKPLEGRGLVAVQGDGGLWECESTRINSLSCRSRNG